MAGSSRWDLCDDVRDSCAQIAARARWVSIDPDALGRVEPGPAPELDPAEHLLEGTPEELALFTLTLDTINFGSGWFPTLRKRPGLSGYRTVAARANGARTSPRPVAARAAPRARSPKPWLRCSARTPDTS